MQEVKPRITKPRNEMKNMPFLIWVMGLIILKF